MGLVVLVIGVVGLGAVTGAVVVIAVLRSRRNSGRGPTGPGLGTYTQNMGYPPQQPIYSPAQQPYPAPPGQPPQHPGPYGQQPPYQGQ